MATIQNALASKSLILTYKTLELHIVHWIH